MKLRKLHVKNYKVFDDLELDFTDQDGKTLDTIVLAGVNGSGKTSLLELLAQSFSHSQSLQVSRQCKTLEIESELRDDELNKLRYAFVNNYEILLHSEYREDDEYDEDSLLGILEPLFDKLQEQTNILSLCNNDDHNDFWLFEIIGRTWLLPDGLLPDALQNKICYIPDDPAIIRKIAKRPENFNEDKQYLDIDTYDGLVRKIDFSKHKDSVSEYMVNTIIERILRDRSSPSEKIISQSMQELNDLLSGMRLHTKLVDITPTKPIFESVNGKRISINDLSGGEKQLYYRAVYLHSLNLQDSIILVDEPETSLHPSWQKNILSLYQRAGKNLQVIVATHSPQVIASVDAKQVFLFKPENGRITVSQPKYSKGHTINYVLSEIMETDYRDTRVGQIVEEYLSLLRTKQHETPEGLVLKQEIDQLDPNSEERMRVEFALRRMQAIGK